MILLLWPLLAGATQYGHGDQTQGSWSAQGNSWTAWTAPASNWGQDGARYPASQPGPRPYPPSLEGAYTQDGARSYPPASRPLDRQPLPPRFAAQDGYQAPPRSANYRATPDYRGPDYPDYRTSDYRPPDYRGDRGGQYGEGSGGRREGSIGQYLGQAARSGARGFDSDNNVDGLPLVTCGSDEMGILVNTERPFLGRIFVKGQSKRRDCVREFLNNTVPEGGLRIPLSSCGMRRERKLAPYPGLEESVTVVVSFHYVFITSSDRAYKVICAYGQDSANTISVVTHGLNISHIPTIAITPTPNLDSYGQNPPDCNYEIRRGGYQGPFALYAEVGDILFHRWTCQGPANLRVLVKSCLVSDGEGEMFVVVDDRGCAVDPAILPDLSYDGNSAWVEAKAFKFADTNFLGFSCTIQVCADFDTCRDISPPACAVEGFGGIQLSGAYDARRLSDPPALSPLLKDEVDVSAPSLNILDSRMFARREEAGVSDSGVSGVVLEGRREGWEVAESGEGVGSVCVSRFWLGLTTILAGGLVLVLGVALIILYLRQPLKP